MRHLNDSGCVSACPIYTSGLAVLADTSAYSGRSSLQRTCSASCIRGSQHTAVRIRLCLNHLPWSGFVPLGGSSIGLLSRFCGYEGIRLPTLLSDFFARHVCNTCHRKSDLIRLGPTYLQRDLIARSNANLLRARQHAASKPVETLHVYIRSVVFVFLRIVFFNELIKQPHAQDP